MKLANMRKALTPFILGVVTVLIQWLSSGELDASELRTAGAGLVTAILVYLIPNDSPEASPFARPIETGLNT